MTNCKNKTIPLPESLRKVYEIKSELIRTLCRAKCSDELNINLNLLRAGLCSMIMSSIDQNGWEECVDEFSSSCKKVLKGEDVEDVGNRMSEVKDSLLKLMETLKEKIGDR